MQGEASWHFPPLSLSLCQSYGTNVSKTKTIALLLFMWTLLSEAETPYPLEIHILSSVVKPSYPYVLKAHQAVLSVAKVHNV